MLANILWVKALAKVEEISLEQMEAIIQAQHNLLSNTLLVLTVLASLIVLIGLGNWIYNIYISQKTLKELREEFAKAIDDAKKEMDKKLTLQKHITEADTCRVKALIATRERLFSTAAIAWLLSVQGYSKARLMVGDDRYDNALVIAIDQATKNLVKCESISKSELESIKNLISHIPDLPSEKRKQIETKLDELEKED